MLPRYLRILPLLFSILKVPQTPTDNLWDLVGYGTKIFGSSDKVLDILLNPNPTQKEHYEIYDFIIVGSGSAGGVLANRLTEGNKFKVLLLEAGGFPTPLNSIPFLSAYNLNRPETDWIYISKPQNNSCLALKNQSIQIPRGKMLGGSSSLNFMIAQRGNPNDYQAWVNATRDDSYSYQNILQYFKKLENYQGNYPNTSCHGNGGPIVISEQVYKPLAFEWVAAGAEHGFKNLDPNCGQSASFFAEDANIKRGKRSGIYQAYIKPIHRRKNLKIIKYATVTKVLFNSRNAIGVQYFRHGRSLTARASKEVILSSGAIGSPHLLMLSGIGNKVDLQQFEIPSISNLPGVGQSLRDHPNSYFGPFCLNSSVSIVVDRDITNYQLFKYVTKGTGVLSFNTISGQALFSTEKPPNYYWPNIIAHLSPHGLHSTMAPEFENILGLKIGTLVKYFTDACPTKDAMFIVVSLGLPKSQGSLKLKSGKHSVHPEIDLNYFSDPENYDITQMVKAFKIITDLIENSKAFNKYNAALTLNHFPGCEGFELKSDEYYECYIRHFTNTMYHQCCTAKMGKISDPNAVVDSEFRVKGIKRLRVVDASVFPNIPNFNINLPSMMLGEKAADIIKHSWSTW